MKITAIASPRYASADGKQIDVMLTTDALGTIPFTASSADPMPYGVDLFNELVAGKHGPIAAYVAPAKPEKMSTSDGKAPGVIS